MAAWPVGVIKLRDCNIEFDLQMVSNNNKQYFETSKMIRYLYHASVAGLLFCTGTVFATVSIIPDDERSFSPDADRILLAGILPTDGEARYELEFWNSIKDSTSASDYEAYLEAYPKGRFAPLAKARIKRYKKTARSAPAAPAAPVKKTVKVEPLDIFLQASKTANVRIEPSAGSSKIDVLRAGQSIQVTGRVDDGKWYRVTTDSGRTGYVFASLLVSKAATRPVRKKSPQPSAPPVAVSAGEVFKDCENCPQMVTLPAGSYTMGNNSGDRSERPAHRVSIKRPFAIGKFEVTVGEWRHCVDAGGCSHFPSKAATSDRAPVRDISWNDAEEYVKWLSNLTGERYRLPTEAEWEYAARAGTSSTYWWGTSAGSGRANCKGCAQPWDKARPADVGSFPANAFGLHDTSGSVWEWVSDCWYDNHKGAPADGKSRYKNNCRQHVIRGGSWRNDASYAHSASRFKYDTYVRYILNGLRVVKQLK